MTTHKLLTDEEIKKEVLIKLKNKHSHGNIKVILFPDEILLEEGIKLVIQIIKERQKEIFEKLHSDINNIKIDNNFLSNKITDKFHDLIEKYKKSLSLLS